MNKHEYTTCEVTVTFTVTLNDASRSVPSSLVCADIHDGVVAAITDENTGFCEELDSILIMMKR